MIMTYSQSIALVFGVGGEVTWTNREGGGLAGCRFKEEGAWWKRGGVFSPILEDRVHAMTLPNQMTPEQKNFFQTMTAWLQNSTKTFIKQTISDSGS